MKNQITLSQIISEYAGVFPFLSKDQGRVMLEGSQGQEGLFFLGKFDQLKTVIESMHKTYEQSESSDPIVHLHYFKGGSDFFITEKDALGGVNQAYGYARLGGMEQFAEFGYISITELVSAGVDLDLHFEPKRFSKCLTN